MLIIGKSILLIINNTRSIQNPKLLFFILIIHHVLKRTCFLINSQKKIFTNVYETWHQAQLANQSWGLTASENIDQYIYYDKCQLEKLLAMHKISQAIIFAKKQTKGWRPARKTIDTRWHNAIINSMPMEDVYPI